MRYKIKISGQESFEFGKTVAIERVFHSRLENYLSASDWVYFCDQVDAVLAPMNDLKKNDNITSALKILFFVVCACLVSVILYFALSKTFQAVFLVIFFVWCLVIHFIRRYRRNIKQQASNTISDVDRNLNNTVDTENNKGHGVTFYTRSNIRQIGIPTAKFSLEYIVRGTEVGIFPIPAASLPVATAIVASTVVEDITPTPSAPPIDKA